MSDSKSEMKWQAARIVSVVQKANGLRLQADAEAAVTKAVTEELEATRTMARVEGISESANRASELGFALKEESYKIGRETEKGERMYAAGSGAHKAATAINELASKDRQQ